jgi:hypothetical protein
MPIDNKSSSNVLLGWRSLLKLRDEVRRFIKFEVGTDNSNFFMA